MQDYFRDVVASLANLQRIQHDLLIRALGDAEDRATTMRHSDNVTGRREIHGKRQLASLSPGERRVMQMIANAGRQKPEAQTAAEVSPPDLEIFRAAPFRLTKREVEVVGHVLEGKSNKEIALISKCSPRTIETHRLRAATKLGARNTAQLVSIVWRTLSQLSVG